MPLGVLCGKFVRVQDNVTKLEDGIGFLFKSIYFKWKCQLNSQNRSKICQNRSVMDKIDQK